MEHSCKRCGTLVEDGRPFCPQCRAPQISVRVEVPEVAIAAGVDSALDEPSPASFQATRSDRPRLKVGMIDRGSAIRAALQAGALGVFIGIIPLLGIALTGALSVFFYRRRSRSSLTAALGARIGGAAGVVAFAINALLIVVRIFIFHAQQEYTDSILKIIQSLGANAADPEIQASVRNLFTPAGLAITLFFGMIVTVAMASLGGALASLFTRSDPKQR